MHALANAFQPIVECFINFSLQKNLVQMPKINIYKKEKMFIFNRSRQMSRGRVLPNYTPSEYLTKVNYYFLTRFSNNIFQRFLQCFECSSFDIT